MRNIYNLNRSEIMEEADTNDNKLEKEEDKVKTKEALQSLKKNDNSKIAIYVVVRDALEKSYVKNSNDLYKFDFFPSDFKITASNINSVVRLSVVLLMCILVYLRSMYNISLKYFVAVGLLPTIAAGIGKLILSNVQSTLKSKMDDDEIEATKLMLQSKRIMEENELTQHLGKVFHKNENKRLFAPTNEFSTHL